MMMSLADPRIPMGEIHPGTVQLQNQQRCLARKMTGGGVGRSATHEERKPSQWGWFIPQIGGPVETGDTRSDMYPPSLLLVLGWDASDTAVQPLMTCEGPQLEHVYGNQYTEVTTPLFVTS